MTADRAVIPEFPAGGSNLHTVPPFTLAPLPLQQIFSMFLFTGQCTYGNPLSSAVCKMLAALSM